MTPSTLSLPGEPLGLKTVVRTLLEQAPEIGLPLVAAGAWIADPLWEGWRDVLERRGMGREQFDRIVASYGNELRLWVVGERPWEQYVSGLAGRLTRRVDFSRPASTTESERWRLALGRVGMTPDAGLEALTSRIGELHLLYEISASHGQPGNPGNPDAAHAVVWAGGRPRDPEVPFGEGCSGSPAAALAEALGRFLLKDPAYPPR
jgi:hypothetical protein